MFPQRNRLSKYTGFVCKKGKFYKGKFFNSTYIYKDFFRDNLFSVVVSKKNYKKANDRNYIKRKFSFYLEEFIKNKIIKNKSTGFVFFIKKEFLKIKDASEIKKEIELFFNLFK